MPEPHSPLTEYLDNIVKLLTLMSDQLDRQSDSIEAIRRDIAALRRGATTTKRTQEEEEVPLIPRGRLEL